MGTCHNCGKQVTLQDKETKCDECFTILNYPCNSCKKWFSVYDENIDDKRKECGICGFFVCPYCGTCSPTCDKDLWQTKIMEIFSPEITYYKFPNLQIKINKLMEYIEELKISKDQKQCPERKVPISYAKQRIKNCVVRMLGYRIKNELDRKKFIERVEEVGNIDLGTKLTINQSREEGSYGQEYRDVFNYCLCLGKLRKQKDTIIIDNEEKKIEVYRRVEDHKCPYLDVEKLILKKCLKCKKAHPLEQEYCNCEIYTKGKNKGEYPKLKIKISNKDICQLNRGLFLKEENAPIKFN